MLFSTTFVVISSILMLPLGIELAPLVGEFFQSQELTLALEFAFPVGLFFLWFWALISHDIYFEKHWANEARKKRKSSMFRKILVVLLLILVYRIIGKDVKELFSKLFES